MFNTGFLNNTGFFKIQCQYPGKAHGLGEFRTQSTISTDPIIADRGENPDTIGTFIPIASVAAECINIRPRKFVFHERFSTSFCPEHIKYAQGFFTVNAFIHPLYVSVSCLSRGKI